MSTSLTHVNPIQERMSLQPRYVGDEGDLFNIVVDLETYYDDDYSLKKMTPVEYILDPRFEVLGCAIAWDCEPGFWVDGPDLHSYFEKIPWSAARVISHNALFDACILAWRYGVIPARWCCTLSMARGALRHGLKSLSLASCAKHIGAAPKGDAVLLAKGYRFHTLLNNPNFFATFKDYAIHDAHLCRGLYNFIILNSHVNTTPALTGMAFDEMTILDICLRMGIEPQFVLDRAILLQHHAEVMQHKQQLLDRLGLDDRSSLMSDELLAGMLRSVGVDPPMKLSKTTGKMRYAFARTDKEFTDLEEDPDPRVQAIVAARLGHKTTIEETRTQRFIDISSLSWPFSKLPWMPVPLAYGGAHTHRFSGDWRLNMQNLSRGSKLRLALKAPPGKVVVAGDASQIEARFLAELAGQSDLVHAFRTGRDVYAEFASEIFGHTVTKATHPHERQIGKVGILSLGYGASWMAFQRMLRTQANILLPDDECSRIVYIYRSRMRQIAKYWDLWGARLPTIASGATPTYTDIEANMALRKNKVWLPTNNVLYYDNLREEADDTGRMNWVYDYGGKTKKIYGSKMVENVTQALAFACVMDAAVRIQRRSNGVLKLALQGHDELVYVVDEKIADAVVDYVRHEMSQPPIWLPFVPLAAEAGKGPSYGEVVKH